jgi:hypothetical protein
MKYIVTIHIDAFDNSRGVCEDIQNEEYEDLGEFMTKIGSPPMVCVYSMSEFMDLYNNEELDEVNTFMTYIRLKKEY